MIIASVLQPVCATLVFSVLLEFGLVRPIFAVEGSVLYGLCYVRGEYIWLSLQVGYGARYLEDAVIGAGREVEPFHSRFHHLQALRGELAVALELWGTHLGVAEYPLVCEAGSLDFAGFLYAGADLCAGFALRYSGEVLKGDGHYLYVNVDTVE